MSADIEGSRPPGFNTRTTTQEFIEIIDDSELANKIEKTRMEVINSLGKKKKKKLNPDQGSIPLPENLDCPVCTLTSGTRVVMTKQKSQDIEHTDDGVHWDMFEQQEIFYHCSNCNMRIFPEDPAFEDYAHTSPDTGLELIAINDGQDAEPIMVSQRSTHAKRKQKQDYQHRLDRIMEKLDDRTLG